MQTIAKQTDWKSLEQEFVSNEDYSMARPWLNEVKGWGFEKLNNGNTQRHINGWGQKRADFRQNLFESAVIEARQLNREIAPAIHAAKAKLLKSLISGIDSMTTAEKLSVLKAFKAELNEPVNITPDNRKTPDEFETNMFTYDMGLKKLEMMDRIHEDEENIYQTNINQ